MTLYCVDACREREPIFAAIIGVATHHSECKGDKSVWVGKAMLHRWLSAK